MKNKITLLILLFSSIGYINAQEQSRGYCGTTVEDQLNGFNAEANRAMWQGLTPRNTDYNVPLKMHLVAKTDGTGRIEKHKVLNALCGLQDVYGTLTSSRTPASNFATPQGNIYFWLKEVWGENINFDNYYIAPDASTMQQCMSSNNKMNQCNVYINENAYVGTGGGDVLGVYIGARDALIFQKSEVTYGSGTFGHEIGHYFTLPHPFVGMEGYINSNSVNSNFAACPDGKMNASISHEYVPRSTSWGAGNIPTTHINCSTAADKFCDTPASWGEGYGFGAGCANNTSCHKDRWGYAQEFDESNIMDYYIGANCASAYHFSAQQVNQMLADCYSTVTSTSGAVTSTRLYGTRRTMTSQTGRNTNLVSTNPLINTPVAGVGNGTNFTMSWDAVPNADYYIVQISKYATFSVIEIDKMFTSATTSMPVTLSTANRNYYARVYAFSNSQFCNVPVTTVLFTSYALGLNEIDYVNSINVAPNPIASGLNLNLNVESEKSFEGEVFVLNASGQQVLQQKLNFEQGENVRSIETANLSSGLYIMNLRSNDGKVKSTKFVVK